MSQGTDLRAGNARRVYELTLGYACNYNCRFCSIAHDKRKTSKTTVEAIADIAQARKEGFRTIGFGGGEPTVREDIIRLTEFAGNSGFGTIRVQTNGMMLSYEGFASRIIAAGANYFKFSIHAHKAEIHDRLTRVAGSFDRAVRGLRNARALGARTSVDIVINRLNYRFLPQYVDYFALREGVSGIGLIYPVYEGAMKENAVRIGVRMTETLPYIRDAVSLARDILLDRNVVFNIPYCLLEAGYHELIPGSRLNLKVNSPGRIEEDVFLGAKGSKVRPAPCSGCPRLDDCGGIWKDYAEIYGLSEIKNRPRRGPSNGRRGR